MNHSRENAIQELQNEIESVKAKFDMLYEGVSKCPTHRILHYVRQLRTIDGNLDAILLSGEIQKQS